MKTKLVLWGTNVQEEKVLIGMELLAEKNKVNVYTFPGEQVTEEFNQKMMQEWRDGGGVEFPESYTMVERELTISESLLPEDIKVERGDLVQRAQTEWHFIVLSSKLNATYQSELSQLRDRIEQLEKFDSKVWDSLKSFWSKVQGQVKERNLFKEHADTLRDMTNELFAQMKTMRTKLDEEFKIISQKHQEEFFGKLDEIGEKVANGLHLQSLFEELKKLQRRFRETKFTREHRTKVWQKLDGTFKTLKEKRFGNSGGGGDDRSPMERLKRRYDGLLSAIEKMERSIGRDQGDLKFEDKRIATTDGQLEAQIRQAKVLMIQERIRSKEEKLKEMLKTKGELEKRMENQKVKDAKRAEREKIEAAKKAAQAKIASEIKEAAAARVEEDDKLAKAAEAIAAQKKPKKQPKSVAEVAPTSEEEQTVQEELAVTSKEEVKEIVENISEETPPEVILENVPKATATEESVIADMIEEPIETVTKDVSSETPVENEVVEVVEETVTAHQSEEPAAEPEVIKVEETTEKIEVTTESEEIPTKSEELVSEIVEESASDEE